MPTKSDKILALLKQGLPVAEIAEKVGASRPYIYSLKNESKKRKAQKRAAKTVAREMPLPKRRGRPADPGKRLKRIERYALALARELAKAA